MTRDRRYGKARLGDMSFDIIDTAGLEEAFDNSVEGMMRQQSEKAFEECDVALFLIDARAGLTPLDNHFADWLRKREKPVYVIANKHEGRDQDPGLYEAYGLGLGDVAPISAEHGLGIELLYDMLEPHWKEWKDRERVARQHAREAAQEALNEARADSLADEDFDDEDGFADDEGEVFPSYEIEFSEDDEDEDGELIVEGARDNSKIQLAIVGRPNAGKSTLLNQLLGEERVMTGPQAGLTRDSIAVDWSYEGRPIRLVDTAGMRRKKKIDDRVEKLSVADTLRVIRYAQVVVLMIDATNTLDKQDLTIARMVLEEGRALIIAVNKWDAIIDKRASCRNCVTSLIRPLPRPRVFRF